MCLTQKIPVTLESCIFCWRKLAYVNKNHFRGAYVFHIYGEICTGWGMCSASCSRLRNNLSELSAAEKGKLDCFWVQHKTRQCRIYYLNKNTRNYKQCQLPTGRIVTNPKFWILLGFHNQTLSLTKGKLLQVRLGLPNVNLKISAVVHELEGLLSCRQTNVIKKYLTTLIPSVCHISFTDLQRAS